MLTPIVITGLTLGVVQLLAGVAIGLWVSRLLESPGSDQLDAKRARRLAQELRTLTAGLSSQAREQHDMLLRADNRLRSEAAEQNVSLAEHPITSLVTGVMREMITANGQLQQRLAAAELELESQVSEMAEHREQAMTDALTGLPNRRALDDHLRLRMEAWRRARTPFSLLMLDIDHFKQFNDTHGHPAGDLALKRVGQALRSALRQQDVVARFGGEEFAVILPDTTLESAQAAVRKVIDAVAGTPIQVKRRSLPLTASVGLASAVKIERVEDLLQRADEALYAAKQNGRNQAWLHDGHKPLAVGELEQPDLLSEYVPMAGACSELRESVAAYLAD